MPFGEDADAKDAKRSSSLQKRQSDVSSLNIYKCWAWFSATKMKFMKLYKCWAWIVLESWLMISLGAYINVELDFNC